MNRNNNTLEGIGAFTVILLAIFTLVISPALSFMFAYIGGCILNFFCRRYISQWIKYHI